MLEKKSERDAKELIAVIILVNKLKYNKQLMREGLKRSVLLFSVGVLAVFFVCLYYYFLTSRYLGFSDGAKFAVVARNLVNGYGYGSDFTFYSPSLLTLAKNSLFGANGVPVLIPSTLSLFFKIFGTNDLSVILFSGTFYILLVLMVYLVGSKIFGKLVGLLSAVVVAANLNYLDYATSGASEPLYSFLTLFSTYLLLFKKKWTNLLFFASLILLYLTKPQGAVFILVLLFSWFIFNFSWKKGLILFFAAVGGIFMIDKTILYPLSFKYPVYPIVTRGIQAIFQYSPTVAVSDALRGQVAGVVGITEVVKKVFYNLYNFYKLLPEILSPYLGALFIIGMLRWTKDKKENVLKILTVLIVIGSLLLTALTISFYRYIHPIVPFVYIFAIDTLVWIVGKIFEKRMIVIITSTLLILFFTVGQTLGVIFLDSRFERNTHNVGKPPVYVKLSWILRDNTDKGQTVITNLDTWGSWYGERKTVWFPLEPKQIIDSATRLIPFDAIYLTSYLIDDENYYMGADWRLIFNNPEDPKKWICEGCGEIAKEFILKGVYSIPAFDNYERQDATGVLFVRR
ncbi:MAG: glycosyltransferase family 39 protein [Candidatus Woesebacteria bacterium]|nr:glycosyltransferase family 39 protein [Candidatus Woesebacteria bacterium]